MLPLVKEAKGMYLMRLAEKSYSYFAFFSSLVGAARCGSKADWQCSIESHSR
jgi:hypothetical protein